MSQVETVSSDSNNIVGASTQPESEESSPETTKGPKAATSKKRFSLSHVQVCGLITQIVTRGDAMGIHLRPTLSTRKLEKSVMARLPKGLNDQDFPDLSQIRYEYQGDSPPDKVFQHYLVPRTRHGVSKGFINFDVHVKNFDAETTQFMNDILGDAATPAQVIRVLATALGLQRAAAKRKGGRHKWTGFLHDILDKLDDLIHRMPKTGNISLMNSPELTEEQRAIWIPLEKKLVDMLDQRRIVREAIKTQGRAIENVRAEIEEAGDASIRKGGSVPGARFQLSEPSQDDSDDDEDQRSRPRKAPRRISEMERPQEMNIQDLFKTVSTAFNVPSANIDTLERDVHELKRDMAGIKEQLASLTAFLKSNNST